MSINDFLSVNQNQKDKLKILIVDDSEMNRCILADMLEDEFEILQAEDGVQAVSQLKTYNSEIVIVMLDMVMPKMDGFDVLAVMNKYHWIDNIPVIMISVEDSSNYIERAYNLGVTDYIRRPFDAVAVHRRVINTIMLYAKQKKLVGLVAEQIYEKEKNNNLMISILSHIVEFRNGESGLHVLHIHTITELLLNQLTKKDNTFNLSYSDISLICTASALHDIGKISIPEGILNKPGRLTDEEFKIMKTHSMIGALMLEDLPFQDEPLVKKAYEICRWHHERYDGRGYPDGLKGDEIPISAQIVSIADVYDALTSERVYKKAFSHEKAMDMILNNECGVFNPILLECLQDISEALQKEMKIKSLNNKSRDDVQNITEKMLRDNELSVSEQTVGLLESERIKYQFFTSISNEFQFEFMDNPPILTIPEWSAEILELPENIIDPIHNEDVVKILSQKCLKEISDSVKKTTPEQPIFQYDAEMFFDGEPKKKRIICRSMWVFNEDEPQYVGFIGKVMDIQKDNSQEYLKQVSLYDPLTGLLNSFQAKKKVKDILQKNPSLNYALVLLKVDYLKSDDENFVYTFKSGIIKFAAKELKNSIKNDDIAARINDDNFLLFINYNDSDNIKHKIKTICNSIISSNENLAVSVSAGIAITETEERDYDYLFKSASRALKNAKNGQYLFSDF